jgi:hypothetical protein
MMIALVYNRYIKRRFPMPAARTQRINITFPGDLLEDFRRNIPRQKRNQFIVELVEREMNRIRLQKALRESAGAWSDEDYPDLMTIEDVNRYVRELRERPVYRVWEEETPETRGPENQND